MGSGVSGGQGKSAKVEVWMRGKGAMKGARDLTLVTLDIATDKKERTLYKSHQRVRDGEGGRDNYRHFNDKIFTLPFVVKRVLHQNSTDILQSGMVWKKIMWDKTFLQPLNKTS